MCWNTCYDFLDNRDFISHYFDLELPADEVLLLELLDVVLFALVVPAAVAALLVVAVVVVVDAVVSPSSSCLSNRYNPAASLMRLNSTQNVSTSMNNSFTFIILLRIRLCRKTHNKRTKRV